MSLDLMFENFDTAIGRDIKLNLKKFLEDSQLSQTESHLALLSLAKSLGSQPLQTYATEKLRSLDVSLEHITEAAQVAALMGMMNIYYRFRYMLENTQADNKLPDAYRVAGLRMNSMMNPALGKTGFEMLAFTVSVLNGCQSCIGAHEKTLRDHGVSEGKIHDLARLAAIAKATATLF